MKHAEKVVVISEGQSSILKGILGNYPQLEKGLCITNGIKVEP